MVKMDRLACESEIRNINQYLDDQMGRFVDSISKKRRETNYKEPSWCYVDEESMELRITPAAYVVTDEPSSTVAATGKRRTPWSAEELSIIDKTGPTAKAQDLIPLLSNRTIRAIHTKILRYQHRTVSAHEIVITDPQTTSVEINRLNSIDLQIDPSSENLTSSASTGIAPGTHFSTSNSGVRLEHTNEDLDNAIIKCIEETLNDPERKIDITLTNLVNKGGNNTYICLQAYFAP